MATQAHTAKSDVPSSQETSISDVLSTHRADEMESSIPAPVYSKTETIQAQPSTSSTTRTEPSTMTPLEPKPTETPFDMLIAVKKLRLTNVPLPAVNSFHANSWQMYTILHYMEICMSINDTISTIVPHYHPLLTRLYYATLFCIQILRCQLQAGLLNHKNAAYVQSILDRCPPESLPVAGPLICFFPSSQLH